MPSDGPIRGSTAHMQMTIAAALAVAAALAELSAVPYLPIAPAGLHPVLVFALVWTIAAGLPGGLAFAFAGGLALDILAQRPLGATAFVLLVCVGAGAVAGNLLGRVRVVAPVPVAFVLSAAYTGLLVVTVTAILGQAVADDPLRHVVPTAVADTVLAALAGPLAVAVVARRRAVERVDW